MDDFSIGDKWPFLSWLVGGVSRKEEGEQGEERFHGWWLVAGGWWLVAGGWWLVAGEVVNLP